MKPAVSIIVPVYNVESYIGKCLDSIINQTLKNIEIIIVNDGSTDHSGSICANYAKKDKRIKVINKENGGLSSARNSGIKIATGEYLGFVDSDDYVDKNMFKNLYMLCKETDSDISVCKFVRELNGNLINEVEEEVVKEMDHLEAMRQLFIGILFRFSVCNKLFKKECFENVLFPEGRIHEDLSTTYKLFAHAKKAVFTNYKGYVYVKRENSILTSKFNEKRLDVFIGWDEILSFMKKNYPQLSKEFISCFAYGSVDNIYNILNYVETKEQQENYLKVIQLLIRKYYSDIKINSALSIKYKFILNLLRHSPALVFALNNSKKFLKWKTI